MSFVRHPLGYMVDTDTGTVVGLRGRLIGMLTQDGYPCIEGQRVNGRRRTLTVHRLVWEAVNGPVPDGLEINHLNGIKTDNRIANLEAVTRQENILHAYRIGLKSNAGEKHPSHRLTDEQVREIRRRYVRYSRNANARVIAADLGVARHSVSDVVAGNTWTHVRDEAAA